MVSSEEEAVDDTGDGSSPAQVAWGLFLAVLLLAAIVVPAYLVLWPDDLPATDDPGFGENVFDNQAVVFAARLVVLSGSVVLAVGALFVVISIAKLGTAQRWFTRFGPFEASPEAIGELAEEAKFWREAALEEAENGQDLTQRLEEADALIESLLAEVDKARTES